MIARFLSIALIAASALGVAVTAASAQAYTTRVEPRPFYGATVTLEEGVRVIRPLPPERHVIIAPSNVPLSLGFNDTRVYENRVVRHYHSSDNRGSRAPSYYSGGGFYAPGYYLGGGKGGHGGRNGGHAHHKGRVGGAR